MALNKLKSLLLFSSQFNSLNFLSALTKLVSRPMCFVLEPAADEDTQPGTAKGVGIFLASSIEANPSRKGVISISNFW